MTLTVHLKSGKAIILRYKDSDKASVMFASLSFVQKQKIAEHVDIENDGVEIFVVGRMYRGMETTFVSFMTDAIEFVQLDAPISEETS